MLQLQVEKLALPYDTTVQEMLAAVVTIDASKYQAPNCCLSMSSPSWEYSEHWKLPDELNMLRKYTLVYTLIPMQILKQVPV